MHSGFGGYPASQQYCPFLLDEKDESEEESDEESSSESDEEDSGSEDEIFDISVCPEST